MRYLEAMREEWARLLDAATRHASEGRDLQAWLDGLMYAIDSDRVVGILDALGTDYPKDGHQAVEDPPPGDLLPPIDPSDFVEFRSRLVQAMKKEIAARLVAQRDHIRERVKSGQMPPLPDLADDEAAQEAVDLSKESRRHRRSRLVVWSVARVSPSGRVRETQAIHASEALAREYIVTHPIPAETGRLEVEAWLVQDEWDGVPGRARDDSRASETAELSDDEPTGSEEGEERGGRFTGRESRTSDTVTPWRRDPEVHSGALCFSGTRVPVSTLVETLAAGQSLDEYLEDYPSVARWKAELYLRGLAARSRVPLDLLVALRPHFEEEHQLGVWLIGANGWLSGDTPLHCLDEPDRLIEAAQRASEPLAL